MLCSFSLVDFKVVTISNIRFKGIELIQIQKFGGFYAGFELRLNEKEKNSFTFTKIYGISEIFGI